MHGMVAVSMLTKLMKGSTTMEAMVVVVDEMEEVVIAHMAAVIMLVLQNRKGVTNRRRKVLISNRVEITIAVLSMVVVLDAALTNATDYIRGGHSEVLLQKG